MSDETTASAEWASDEDHAAYISDLFAHGKAYRTMDSEGKLRRIDPSDFYEKPPEPGPNEIKNPWRA